MWALNGNFNGDQTFSNAVIRNPGHPCDLFHPLCLSLSFAFYVHSITRLVSLCVNLRWCLSLLVGKAIDLSHKKTDLILPGKRDQHLLVGVTYEAKHGESLQAVASRFRTTVKSILSLNFDLDAQVEANPMKVSEREYMRERQCMSVSVSVRADVSENMYL